MQKCGISKTYVAMLKEVNQKLKMMTSVSFKPYNNTLLYNFTIQNVFKSFEMSSQKKSHSKYLTNAWESFIFLGKLHWYPWSTAKLDLLNPILKKWHFVPYD